MNTSIDGVTFRRTIYVLLTTIAVGSIAGRIMSVARLSDLSLYRSESDPATDPRGIWPKTRPEPMPTHGDNDRSRWDTVRALVDNGTYVIGHRETTGPQPTDYRDTGIISQDGWRTIDKVLRPETQDFYSSKPPFLATVVAGEYWLLNRTLGWSIVEQRWEVVRLILISLNAVPFAIYLFVLGRLLDRLGQTDWGRLYVFAAGAFGTLLTTFAVTFNNHSVGTCSALFALYPTLRIWYDDQVNGVNFSLAGFFAGFTAACEMPAALVVVLFFALLFRKSSGRAIAIYLPAAAIPIAFFLVTNYLAIGQWQPAYDNFGGPWYEYEGSHWKPDPIHPKHGIDWAFQTESRLMYGFHVLIGHHGVLSLSPIFVLSAIAVAGLTVKGMGRILRKEIASNHDLYPLALLTLVITIVVVGFYVLAVNDRNRNYGGWTSGLRWLMWLTPFWLITMLPAADWLASRRWGRGLAAFFLGMSVFSVAYAWNPWRHPWIYNWLESQGWISY